MRLPYPKTWVNDGSDQPLICDENTGLTGTSIFFYT